MRPVRRLPRRYPGPHYEELRPDQKGRDGIPIAHLPGFAVRHIGGSAFTFANYDQASYEWSKDNWATHFAPVWDIIHSRGFLHSRDSWRAYYDYIYAAFMGAETAVLPLDLPPASAQQPAEAAPPPPPPPEPPPTVQPAAKASQQPGGTPPLLILALLALAALVLLRRNR